MNKSPTARLGFTLIELLVVVSIIGLLSSVVLASLSGARESARDVVRFNDLGQLETAMEMYLNEKGQYPCGDANGTISTGGRDFSFDTSLSDGFLSGPDNHHSGCPTGSLEGLDDVGAYPLHIKTDPVNNVDSFYYSYQAEVNRSSYLLYVPLESSDRAEEDGGLCDNYYEVGPGVGDIPIVINHRYHEMPFSCN